MSTSLDPQTTRRYEQRYLLHTWTAQKDFDPMVITRAEGVYFWDEKGQRYLDFASQLINVNAGHQHPKIVAAIKEQAERLCYAVPSAANDQRALLGKLLAERAPGDLNKSFLVTGGGVANENALKIARAVTGRQKVISRYRSYHGATYGASSVTGDPRHRATEPGVPGTVRVWDPFCYRCFFKMTYPDCEIYCAEAIREVIEVEGPETVAAMIVEPITGSNGRILPPGDYMQRLRRICDDYGMLLIFDEVMTGFGRTGQWFAAQHWDAVPDIMTLSKGINNGTLPLAAVMVREPIAAYFDEHILYSGLTQYGNPVACAAGVATIRAMEEEGMIENSRALGEHLLEHLEHIKAGHPSVGDVRGLGLFAAIELVRDRQTREPIAPWTVQYYERKHPLMKKLLADLKAQGLYAYSRWNVLFICPPLCITQEQLGWGLERIDRALEAVDQAVAGGRES
jgi:taurine--2-oxoglutarate transaminase